jgi:hypothetical protein
VVRREVGGRREERREGGRENRCAHGEGGGRHGARERHGKGSESEGGGEGGRGRKEGKRRKREGGGGRGREYRVTWTSTAMRGSSTLPSTPLPCRNSRAKLMLIINKSFNLLCTSRRVTQMAQRPAQYPNVMIQPLLISSAYCMPVKHDKSISYSVLMTFRQNRECSLPATPASPPAGGPSPSSPLQNSWCHSCSAGEP